MGRPAVSLLLVGDFLYWASMYLYAPVLPSAVEARTGSLAAVGLVASMYGLAQALARIPSGVVLDATGRGRPLLAAGFALSAAGALVLGAGRGTAVLAFGRALTGLAAATWVPMVAVFGGLFPADRIVAATSALTLVGAAGRLAAMVIGGILAERAGAGASFGVAALAAGLAIASLIAVRLPTAAPRPFSWGRIVSVARRREVVVPTLAQTAASFANWAVTMTFLPIAAGRMGAGGAAKGMLLSLNTAATLVGNLLPPLAQRKLGLRASIRLAFFVYCAGILWAALAGTLGAMFGAAAMMGLANGLYYPVLMGLAAGGVPPEERATATGIHQAVYGVGMFLGPSAGGLLAERIGIQGMFFATAALTLAISWALTAVLEPPRALRPPKR